MATHPALFCSQIFFEPLPANITTRWKSNLGPSSCFIGATSAQSGRSRKSTIRRTERIAELIQWTQLAIPMTYSQSKKKWCFQRKLCFSDVWTTITNAQSIWTMKCSADFGSWRLSLTMHGLSESCNAIFLLILVTDLTQLFVSFSFFPFFPFFQGKSR